MSRISSASRRFQGARRDRGASSVRRTTASDTVRIWIPGCATGEEVYSVGILLREHMDILTEIPRVQIFATDIDEPAIAVARAGRYPETLLEAVSAERRRRFFDGDGASYVLRKDVRELCIFSPHSVIRAPPFSRMDLVSCRNLLIYFGRDVQARVIPTFHYALKPGGYLFSAPRKASASTATRSPQWIRNIACSGHERMPKPHRACR